MLDTLIESVTRTHQARVTGLCADESLTAEEEKSIPEHVRDIRLARNAIIGEPTQCSTDASPSSSPALLRSAMSPNTMRFDAKALRALLTPANKALHADGSKPLQDGDATTPGAPDDAVCYERWACKHCAHFRVVKTDVGSFECRRCNGSQNVLAMCSYSGTHNCRAQDDETTRGDVTRIGQQREAVPLHAAEYRSQRLQRLRETQQISGVSVPNSLASAQLLIDRAREREECDAEGGARAQNELAAFMRKFEHLINIDSLAASTFTMGADVIDALRTRAAEFYAAVQTHHSICTTAPQLPGRDSWTCRYDFRDQKNYTLQQLLLYRLLLRARSAAEDNALPLQQAVQTVEEQLLRSNHKGSAAIHHQLLSQAIDDVLDGKSEVACFKCGAAQSTSLTVRAPSALQPFRVARARGSLSALRGVSTPPGLLPHTFRDLNACGDTASLSESDLSRHDEDYDGASVASGPSSGLPSTPTPSDAGLATVIAPLNLFANHAHSTGSCGGNNSCGCHSPLRAQCTSTPTASSNASEWTPQSHSQPRSQPYSSAALSVLPDWRQIHTEASKMITGSKDFPCTVTMTAKLLVTNTLQILQKSEGWISWVHTHMPLPEFASNRTPQEATAHAVAAVIVYASVQHSQPVARQNSLENSPSKKMRFGDAVTEGSTTAAAMLAQSVGLTPSAFNDAVHQFRADYLTSEPSSRRGLQG